MRARGFAVNRHALNTLRIRGVSFERGDTGPRSLMSLVEMTPVRIPTPEVVALFLYLRHQRMGKGGDRR